MGFDIFLKLMVDLAFSGFFSDFDAVRAVVSDNAAPECIIEVKCQRFFVFSINRLDDSGYARDNIRDCFHAHRIFVHVPEARVIPPVQTKRSRNIMQVIDIKTLMRRGIVGKSFVQSADEARIPVHITGIAVSHQAPSGVFKIILDDWRMKSLSQLIPHHLKMLVLTPLFFRNCFLSVRKKRSLRQIAVRRMDINDVWLKFLKLFFRKHGILPVPGVFRFVKGRLDAVV